MSNNSNQLSGISFFASPQATDEGYGTADNQEMYLASLETDVSLHIARHLEIMSLFVNFKQFERLQEENGAKFPYYLRMNDTMPTRGSAYSYAPATTFDRPSTYDRATVWVTDSLKRSLWQMRAAKAMTDEQFNAEYERVLKSFVQFVFQECFIELALSLRKQHFQFYKDTLVSQMMVEQFRGLDVFSTRGEKPSDALKGILNRLLTNIDNTGAVILAHDSVLTNLKLMSETKYETALTLLMDKMSEYSLIPFKQGFLDDGRQLLMNRLPTAAQNNITIDKYISHYVASPIVIVPLDAFDSSVGIFAPGAENHRLFELFLDGLAKYNTQTSYADTVPSVAVGADTPARRTASEANAKVALAANFKYVAFILPEVAVIGHTMATGVMPTNPELKPVTLYITALQDGADVTNQGGTSETVVRQAMCAGNTNFQGTFANPCARFLSSDDASDDPASMKPWQSGVYEHQKILLTAADMVTLDKSFYGKDGLYFPHLGFDSGSGSVLATKLFNPKRFTSLTAPTIDKEYCRRGLDDVSCELYYQGGNFFLTRVPMILSGGTVTASGGPVILTTDHNITLHSLLMDKPMVEKDKILDISSLTDRVAF